MSNPNPNTSGLKSWEHGQSGNSKGRPVGCRSMTTLVREALESGLGLNTSKSLQDLLVQRILDKAINKGDTRMIQIIWEHLDGRPNKKSDHMAELTEQNKENIAELTEALRAMANGVK